MFRLRSKKYKTGFKLTQLVIVTIILVYSSFIMLFPQYPHNKALADPDSVNINTEILNTISLDITDDKKNNFTPNLESLETGYFTTRNGNTGVLLAKNAELHVSSGQEAIVLLSVAQNQTPELTCFELCADNSNPTPIKPTTVHEETVDDDAWGYSQENSNVYKPVPTPDRADKIIRGSEINQKLNFLSILTNKTQPGVYRADIEVTAVPLL